MIKRILLYIISFHSMISGVLTAGEKEDLYKLGKVYEGAVLSLDFKMEVVYSSGRKENTDGVYRRSPQGYYYSVLNLESFSDQQTTVVIDKMNHLMIVADVIKERNKAGEELGRIFAGFSFDSAMVADMYTLKYKINTPDKKVIVIRFKDTESMFTTVEVAFNARYELSQVVFVPKKSASGEYISTYSILYKPGSVKTGGKLKLPFNLSHYVVVSGGKLKPAIKFSDYKVIDNRVKKY